MSNNDNEAPLPPLPEPFARDLRDPETGSYSAPLFTADQLRDYVRADRASRERAAAPAFGSALRAPVGQLGSFEMFDYPGGFSRPRWVPAAPQPVAAQPSAPANEQEAPPPLREAAQSSLDDLADAVRLAVVRGYLANEISHTVARALAFREAK